MFVWAKVPEKFQEMGSLEFSKLVLQVAKVAEDRLSEQVQLTLRGVGVAVNRPQQF
jgi:hypothetical protein